MASIFICADHVFLQVLAQVKFISSAEQYFKCLDDLNQAFTSAFIKHEVDTEW